MSRSPFSYCILASKVAQRVSKRVPLGIAASSLNNPIHFNPPIIRDSSEGEEKFAIDLTLAMRVACEESVAPIALAVISF